MTAVDRIAITPGVDSRLTSVMMPWWCGVVILLSASVLQPCVVDARQLYTNTFAVKLHAPDANGGNGHVTEAAAHLVAKRAGSGFENVGKVGWKI